MAKVRKRNQEKAISRRLRRFVRDETSIDILVYADSDDQDPVSGTARIVRRQYLSNSDFHNRGYFIRGSPEAQIFVGASKYATPERRETIELDLSQVSQTGVSKDMYRGALA